GNQKTAIKFSAGKYMQAGTTGFSNSVNPLALTTASVAWTDLNGDGVPQGELGCVYLTAGCEMNLAAQLPSTFGRVTPVGFDPNIKRMYNVEETVGVQHELFAGTSVSAGWYHREYFNLRRRFNTAIGAADFTPFTVYSPIDGSPITYHNVSASKVAGLTQNLT